MARASILRGEIPLFIASSLALVIPLISVFSAFYRSTGAMWNYLAGVGITSEIVHRGHEAGWAVKRWP